VKNEPNFEFFFLFIFTFTRISDLTVKNHVQHIITTSGVSASGYPLVEIDDRSAAQTSPSISPNTWGVLHHDNYSPDLSPWRLFALSAIENSPRRTTFWDTTEHSNVSDRPPPTEGYSGIRVPELP